MEHDSNDGFSVVAPIRITVRLPRRADRVLLGLLKRDLVDEQDRPLAMHAETVLPPRDDRAQLATPDERR